MKLLLVFLLNILMAFQVQAELSANLVIGTHVTDGHKGVYIFKVDKTTGMVNESKTFINEYGSSVTARQLKNGVAYTCGATEDSKKGQIIAIDLESSKVISKVSSHGGGPCYVAMSPDKRFLFVANIKGGTVCSFSLKENGEIEKLITKLAIKTKVKPFKPHAVVISPDGRYLFVPDIAGRLLHRVKVDTESGALGSHESISSDNFKAPRHFLFDQEGKTAYLVNQTGESVTVFKYESSTGALSELGNVQSLPDDQLDINNHIAEIKLHPSGKFVYVSNRGHNSLTLYSRDLKTGNLSFVKCFSSEGQSPWSFALDKAGEFIYCTNRKSNNLAVFKVDSKTGYLTFTGQKISVTAPSSVYLFD